MRRTKIGILTLCLGGGALVVGLASSPALALITVTPGGASNTEVGSGPTTNAVLSAGTNGQITQTAGNLAYKAEVGNATNPLTVEEGGFASSYNTTFSNSPLDPANFTITFTGLPKITCPVCWLEVKGPNNGGVTGVTRYFYNIAGWDGMMSIQGNGTGFWNPGQGAISHVSIWNIPGGGGPNQMTPEPGTLFLMGSGLAGLGLWRWKTKK